MNHSTMLMRHERARLYGSGLAVPQTLNTGEDESVEITTSPGWANASRLLIILPGCAEIPGTWFLRTHDGAVHELAGMEPYFRHASAARWDVIVLNPNEPQRRGAFEEGTRQIRALLDRLAVRSVEPQAIALLGFSMGTAAALTEACRSETPIDALLLLDPVSECVTPQQLRAACLVQRTLVCFTETFTPHATLLRLVLGLRKQTLFPGVRHGDLPNVAVQHVFDFLNQTRGVWNT